jgi:metallo-beta-lactamase family protein
MHGHEVRIRARIETLEHLSGHADYGEILGWLGQFRTPPQQTFIVHGEPKSAAALEEKITRQLRWKVHVPTYLERVLL